MSTATRSASASSCSSTASDMEITPPTSASIARVPVPAIHIAGTDASKLQGVLSPCTPAPATPATPADMRRTSLEIPIPPRKRMRTSPVAPSRRPAFLRFTPDALLSSNDPLTPPMCSKPVEPIPTPDAPRKINLPPSPVGLSAATFGADTPPVARRLLFAD